MRPLSDRAPIAAGDQRRQQARPTRARCDCDQPARPTAAGRDCERSRRPAGAGRSGDRGSITLWSLAICIGVLAFGGVTLDLWQAITGWRRLAAAADAAAAAGASGIDEAAFRSSGGTVVRLSESEAIRRAEASLAEQVDDGDIDSYEVVEVTDQSVTVVVRGSVDLTLPQIVLDDEPITMSVTATAAPRVSG